MSEAWKKKSREVILPNSNSNCNLPVDACGALRRRVGGHRPPRRRRGRSQDHRGHQFGVKWMHIKICVDSPSGVVARFPQQLWTASVAGVGIARTKLLARRVLGRNFTTREQTPPHSTTSPSSFQSSVTAWAVWKFRKKFEVLCADSKPILGLFAVGEVAGCVHGNNQLEEINFWIAWCSVVLLEWHVLSMSWATE